MKLNVILIVTVLNCVSTIFCKSQFNAFLTDDNELSPIETKKTKSNNTINSSKLIVKILYQKPKPVKDTIKNAIVYSTLDNSSGPCDKNVCKANQICLNKPNDKKEPYKCLNKPKSMIKRDVTTKSTTTTRKKIVLSQKCNYNGLTNLKIGLFEIFDTLKEVEKLQIDKMNAIEFSCSEPVCRLFSDLDFNHDRQLNKLEWSRLNEFKTDDCMNDLNLVCDKNSDESVSFEEFCTCFQGIRSKCSYIRLNKDTKNIYIEQINKFLKPTTKLTVKSYAPICDSEGYFLPTQCDNKVTCWCVKKNGDPIEDSLSGINQTPKDCKSFY